ncbi:hypothetical protein MNV49_005561 [Pseudohyphozyma bogoriensis]|nr:hypothetical protein MNV49_005561 [Pseudohyphozyma bogoriensis]
MSSAPESSPLTSPNSVRVRRNTVSRPPVFGSGSSPPPPASASPSSSPALGATQPTGRRRAATMTQRLFADSNPYAPIPEDGAALSASPGGGASSSAMGRGRSASVASGEPPIVLSVPGRPSMEATTGRERAASLVGPAEEEQEHHAREEVDLLEVMDQSVSTTATLTNIQSAFIPNFFTRQPVVQLDPPTPVSEEGGDVPLQDATSSTETLVDPLDKHLVKLLKKQKRKAQLKEVWKGCVTFLKTPIGVCALFYMILVVLAGGSLVLMLMIPFNSYRKKLWIEIDSQILTGLFTITSLLPLPWRVKDWYNITVISHYARVTAKRRAKLGLKPLRDKNDLPDPANAEFWVGPGGVKMTGDKTPAVTPVPHPKKKKKAKDSATPENVERVDELSKAESGLGMSGGKGEGSLETAGPPDESLEEVVLTPKEEERLRRCQIRFAKSQTWYRPHTSPTHHASPIKWAIWYTIAMIGNSIFQAMLCGVMWGLDRWERPAWTTGCLIPLSFGCGIAAAVIVWQVGVKTKRKAEVTAALWAILKADEEKLEAKRKAITEEKAAAKAAAKHNHSHSFLGGHHDEGGALVSHQNTVDTVGTAGTARS